MKKEKKEKLHEDDRFVRFVDGVWRSVTARRRRLNVILPAVVTILVAVGIYAAVREQRAGARLNTIDSAETVAKMEKAVQAYPDSYLLRMRLGVAYWERNKAGDLERAEGSFGEALAAAGSKAERAMASLELGKVRLELRRFEEALKLFGSAAEIQETKDLIGDEANWYAGRCLELLNKPQEARDKYALVGGWVERGPSVWQGLANYRQIQLRRRSVD